MNEINEFDDIEYAPEVGMVPTWIFRLSKRDSLLILKALRGTLKTVGEQSAAKELGDRLTVLRAKVWNDHGSGLMRATEWSAIPKTNETP